MTGSIGSLDQNKPIMRTVLLPVLLAVALLCGACGSGEGDLVEGLQLVGVDFELNSIMLTNGGGEDLRTDGVWIYQDGDAFMLNIFTIEPRATILFSVGALGGVDAAGGEIALFTSESFSDEESVLDYVAWGTTRHHLIDTGVVAGTWSEIGPVTLPANTLALIRFDPQFFGPDGWEPYTGDE